MSGRHPRRSGGVMTRVDKAVLVLGVVSLASAVSTVANGDLDVFGIGGWGVAVAVGLGLLAVLAGWLGWRPLALLAAASYLAAAATQVAQLGGRLGAVEHGVLGGNVSTVALWTALGIGLAVLGLTREPEPEPTSPSGSTSSSPSSAGSAT